MYIYIYTYIAISVVLFGALTAPYGKAPPRANRPNETSLLHAFAVPKSASRYHITSMQVQYSKEISQGWYDV